MTVILVVVLALVAASHALPGGAPASTCDNLTPQHPGTALPNPSPYEIDLSAFVGSYGAFAGSLAYLPGQYYTITLQARNMSNATFRGFLIQARDMSGMAVGEFLDPAPSNNLTRLSSCTPPEISVTHNQPGDRNLRVDMMYATFTWRAPTTVMTGPIRFWYTTVQTFTTFWVAETTDQISEIPLICPGAGVNPEVGGGAGSVSSLGLWVLLGTALFTALKITF